MRYLLSALSRKIVDDIDFANGSVPCQNTTLEMQGTDSFLKDYTPAQRMAMVWPF